MPEKDPARQLLDRWQTGDAAAATELFHLYSQRLCAVAQSQIDRRLAGRVGAEDIVQSVFRTFFRRSRNGQFQIDHAGALWRLLVRITLNKVQHQRDRHHAARRNVAAEVHLESGEVSPEAIAHEPTPAEAAALSDEIESTLAGLQAPEAEILRLSLQGYTPSEIAARVQCSRWTVRRVLNRIGHRLQARLSGPGG